MGEDDLAVGLAPLAVGGDAGRAAQIELVVDGVEQHAHVAQDEPAQLPPHRRFWGKQGVDVLLRFCDCPFVLHDETDDAQTLGFVRQLQKRAGVALGQLVLAQRLQDGRRMAQDAQLVGDGGLALADAAGGLLLAEVILLHG